MYAARYGSDFKTRDIAILYTLYEEELEKLNLVVSVCLHEYHNFNMLLEGL
jgi:hypothetical protein